MKAAQHKHRELKICISGAAETSFCGADAYDKARTLGHEVARAGAVLVTGATTGFPLWAAMGAKEAGGKSIGISPATSEREHVEVFRLPIDYMDFIIYTGFGYAGRDIILTRSADAILFGCGRIGTIHEFTVAFEDVKPIGVLEGEWELDETIKTIIERGHRPHSKIVFDTDPKKLVAQIVEMVNTSKIEDRMTYSYRPAEPPMWE